MKIKILFLVGIIILVFSINITNAATTSLPAGAVQLSLLPHHEDTSVQISVDLTKLADNYYSLNVYCKKENGKLDFPLQKMSPMCGNALKGSSVPPVYVTLEKRIYITSVSNLSPNSTYEFCLTGINSSYQSTGDFECATITTDMKKAPVSLVFVNYDVSKTTRDLVKRYQETIRASNPDVVIVEYAPTQKISSSEMLAQLRAQYVSTNLKYVTMIGFDLPVPQTPGSTQYFADPYRHLSVDQSVMDRDFIYTLNSEVTLAVIRAENEQDMQRYFNRLYQFYTGSITYDKKLLIADAMIPSEASIGLIDKPNRYATTSVDYVTGIKNYFDPVISIASNWQNSFGQYLAQSHEISIINAHGSTNFHYPCRMDAPNNDEGCIASPFIKRVQPASEFIIGISCNIGNFMTTGSPMVAYIFSGNSLAGLGAEVPLWDVNGQIAKTALKDLAAGRLIGDIARMSGFVVIGDPFLRLDMPQNYKPPVIPLSLSPQRITVDANQIVKLSLTVPSDTLKTSMYMACPSGLSTTWINDDGKNVLLCNRWTYFESPKISSMNVQVTNSTKQTLRAVPNFYAYYPNNPNFANGVSSEITVNPTVSTPTPIPTPIPPPSFYPSQAAQPLTETIRSTTLMWIVNNASSCMLTGPNFPANSRFGTNESISTGIINFDSTYTLTCTNSSGLSASKSLTIILPKTLTPSPVSVPTPTPTPTQSPSSTATPSPISISEYSVASVIQGIVDVFNKLF